MTSRRAEKQSENHLVLSLSLYPILSFLLFHFPFYFCSIHFISLTSDEEKWRTCDAAVFIFLSLLFYSLWACCFFHPFTLLTRNVSLYRQTVNHEEHKRLFLSVTFFILSLCPLLSLSLSLLLVTWEVLRWWREGDQSAKMFFFSLFTCFLFSPSVFYLPSLIQRVLWGW